MEATAETNTGEVAPAMVWTEVYFPSDEVKELKGVETIHKVPSFKSGSDPTDSGYSLSIPDPPKVG